MKRILFLLLLSITTLGVIAQTKTEQLAALMDHYAAQGKLNGSVLVTQGGKTLLNRGYGFSNIKDSIPIAPGTVFQIGSLTKQFTATAILKLQEMGLLSVSDKLSKYLPGFPNGDSISIEHLLIHTSGIFNYTDDKEFMQHRVMRPVTENEMISIFKGKPSAFQPGTDWAYSNSNYLLLGYIIRKITHKPYEQVIRELILEPLGMCSTGFDFAGLKSPEKAVGYKHVSGNGIEESLSFDSTVSYAAGAMYSTVEDLYKWQVGLSGNRLLTTTSLKRANTPVLNKYGYGNYIDSIYGKRLIAHGGLTFGFTSYMGRINEDDVCIIILNNLVNMNINQIAKDVLAILYDRPYRLPEGRKEITLSPELLKEYTGRYEIAPQTFVDFTIEDNRLYAQASGHPKLQLFAESEDSFFVEGADIHVEFKRDAGGNLIKMNLIEDGLVIPGKQLK